MSAARLLSGWGDDGDVLERSWRWLLAALVLVLHVFALLALQRAMAPRPGATDPVLEVIFLRRSPEPPTPPDWPSLPQRPAAEAAASATPVAASERSPTATEAAPAEAAERERRWLGTDGSLRWALEAPAYSAPDATARLWRRPAPRLPGASDAAAAEAVAVRLRRSLTPEQAVNAVLRFLFGQLRPDDCGTIEHRLLLSDPGVSREIDLNKFRRSCRG